MRCPVLAIVLVAVLHHSDVGAFQLSTTTLHSPSSSSTQAHDGVRASRVPRATEESTAAEETKDPTEEEGQTVAAASFGLIKANIGTGILTLPYGLAAMSDRANVVLPATAVMMVVSVLSAYTFALVGRLAHQTGANTMGELWEREIGKESSWVIDVSTFIFAMGCTLTFSIVLGDFLSGLAQGVGATGWMATRQTSILTITALALYPLSLMKSLSALAPVSIAGVFGIGLTGLYMVARCLTPAYKLPHGKFLKSVPLLPSFGVREGPFNPLSSLILGSMLANAFLAHFSAPDFVQSLKQDDRLLPNFAKLTAIGFGATAIINTMIMVAGFLTFGGNTVGVILNNYSTQDLGAALCRILSIVSIIGGFPFLLRPAKKALFNLFFRGEEVSTRTDRAVASGMVLALTLGAMVMKNAGIIVSFNGALMGSAIIYIYPSMMFLANRQRGSKLERILNRALIGFGVAVGAMGGIVSFLSVYAPQVLGVG